MKWYRIEDDGTASVHDDSPEICEQIDRGEGRWFATPEGAILHGGVKATAFTRRVEQLYDALIWLTTGAMVPVEKMTVTEITAP